MKKRDKNLIGKFLISIIIVTVIAIGNKYGVFKFDEETDVKEYTGEIIEEINQNISNFTAEDMNLNQDFYSEIQNGRVGMAMIKTNWNKANADEQKDDYSWIKPTGFVQKKYDTNIVPGGYLYHRCHIIAWKLGGRDVDERNLMTGTQSFNVQGMKEYEDKVYDYLKENKTNNVMYRVTPKFEGNNKLASGVSIEAYSVEDNGKLQFNVFIHNAQKGISIDYATGKSEVIK